MSDSISPKERRAASVALRAALGSPDAPVPSIPFGGADTYPTIDLAWQLVQRQYPEAASGVTEFGVLGPLDRKTGRSGGALMAQFDRDRRIKVHPSLEQSPLERILDIISHELVHARQAMRAPNFLEWLKSDPTPDEREAYSISDATGGGLRPKMRRDIRLN